MIGAGARGQAIANRAELIRRLVVALERPGVSGLLGTSDVLADLLLLGAVDGKLVVGRSLLFPPGDDVEGAVDGAVALLQARPPRRPKWPGRRALDTVRDPGP